MICCNNTGPDAVICPFFPRLNGHTLIRKCGHLTAEGPVTAETTQNRFKICPSRWWAILKFKFLKFKLHLWACGRVGNSENCTVKWLFLNMACNLNRSFCENSGFESQGHQEALGLSNLISYLFKKNFEMTSTKCTVWLGVSIRLVLVI